MKKEKTLKVPCLSKPAFLIWCKGFWDGHVLQTGEFDADGKLSSSYLTEQRSFFNQACLDYTKDMEEDLHEKLATAESTLSEYKYLAIELDDFCQDKTGETTSRAAKKRQNQISSKSDLYKQKGKELLSLLNDIQSEVYIAEKKMASTATKLGGLFAVYGHGMMLAPVTFNHLPVIEFQHYIDDFKAQHKDIADMLLTIKQNMMEED